MGDSTHSGSEEEAPEREPGKRENQRVEKTDPV